MIKKTGFLIPESSDKRLNCLMCLSLRAPERCVAISSNKVGLLRRYAPRNDKKKNTRNDNPYRWIWVIFIFFLFLPSIAVAEDVGIIVALKGKTFILRDNKTLDAVLKDMIFLRDMIETKEASRTKMLFKDDSLLTLAENSRVNIKEYLFAEGKKKGKSIFNLVDGKVRSLVGAHEFEINTPTVVVAARGTYFITWVGIEEGILTSGVAVIEGAVELKSNNPAIKGVVKLEKGMMSKTLQNKAPLPPVPTPAPLIKELINATDLQSTPEPEKKPVIEERKPEGVSRVHPAARDEGPQIRQEKIPVTPPIVNQEPPRVQDTPVRIRIPMPPAETPVTIKIPIPEGL